MSANLPRGVRDFSDSELKKRNYIIQTFKDIFILNGFKEIQTPAFETLDTLTKKYGTDSEKLIFKILNSGDFLKNVNTHSIDNLQYKTLSGKISKNALRYDLTVPFARYLVMHQNEINFPFKRYQIQPVWRADRPQKGRFREFYQCDIDIAGSHNLLNEAEVIGICIKAFKKLNIPNFKIKINNRKILYALKTIASEHVDKIIIILDKYDKIGINGILEELHKLNLQYDQQKFLLRLIEISNINDNSEKIEAIKTLFKDIEIGLQGADELETIMQMLSYSNIDSSLIEIDTKLARGLSYYTGLIVEAICLDCADIGSICGGGRYDKLTESLSKISITGIGLSFGIDRIYSILESNNRFPYSITVNKNILILNLNIGDLKNYINILNQLHNYGMQASIYPDQTSIKKQLNYANKEQIQYVIIQGEEEKTNNKISLKNMKTGCQYLLNIAQLPSLIINK